MDRLQIGSQQIELKLNRYVIGRSEECDILLPEDDALVSRRHAILQKDSSGVWWVLDMESTNGVFVNGARIVDRARIQPGSTFSIGHQSMTLDGAAVSSAPAPARPAHQVVIQPTAPTPAPAVEVVLEPIVTITEPSVAAPKPATVAVAAAVPVESSPTPLLSEPPIGPPIQGGTVASVWSQEDVPTFQPPIEPMQSVADDEVPPILRPGAHPLGTEDFMSSEIPQGDFYAESDPPRTTGPLPLGWQVMAGRVAFGIAAASLLLPWVTVDALLARSSANYLTILKTIADAIQQYPRALQQEPRIAFVALPLISVIVMGIGAFLNTGRRWVVLAGGILGLVSCIGLFQGLHVGVIDLSGLLGFGFYLFGLGSILAIASSATE